MAAAVGAEILVIPSFGQGHLFPCMELCKHFSSRNYKTTLIISSNLSSSVPSSLRHNPLIEIVEIEASSSPPTPPPPSTAEGPGPGFFNLFHRHQQQMSQGIESFLSSRFGNPDQIRPVCAVIDVMMSSSKEVFMKFDVPLVSFFTSGACASAMEYSSWKAHADDLKPGEIRILPGLPEDMALSYSEIKRRPRRPPPPIGGDGGPPGQGAGFPGPPGGKKFGPPGPGMRPMWVDEIEGSIALLINTCDDLERPFIDYVASQIGLPVWGVGPLLPEEYWKSAGSILRDRDIRQKRQSNYTEDDVIQWLDSKPRGSVIYISFGSEVGPTLEEYAQLADALEESNRPFIWVIQPGSGKSGPPRALLLGGQPSSDPKEEEGYYPHGLDGKVGDRGLIIRGWAPQLMILSHPSTGGFLSHCGWNSTVEAIGRGVPFLAWPIRGDQFHDAKLVVCHLKIGYMVWTGDVSEMVKKEDIVQGIERLMADEEVHKRAAAVGRKFERGFPASSEAHLDAFRDFINQRAA
uniref:Putative UDP-glycosyltransferase 73C2 n=1 Tax=Davidia involucrata TaxID=16924 RepID=A0A5B6YLF1_DAVIN